MSLNYAIEYAKSGRSSCKVSKEKIEKGELRVGKQAEDDFMQWHKVIPFFQWMSRMKKKENALKNAEDMAGFDELTEEDQEKIRKMLSDFYDPDVDFPPKAPKRKKSEASDDGEDTPAPKRVAKPKKSDLPPIPEETREVEISGLKDLATELVTRIRDRGLQLPEDEAAARKRIGSLIMANKSDSTVDIAAVIKAADSEFKLKVTVECINPANEALALAFLELSGFAGDEGDYIKRNAYKKVSDKIAEQEDPITSGKQAQKLPSIGKSSAEKIDEFLTTGAIAKLQAYKQGA